MGFNKTLLEGKKILITGAGKGIGRSCALSCASLGAKVIAVARTESDLNELARLAQGNIETWVEDVTSEEMINRIRQLDRLDGLVNNAGTNRVGQMETQSGENVDAIINLNIRALYRVSQASIPVIKRSGGGSIVNMSSQMGHVGSEGRTLYCMSKHAVEGLTKAMAVELAKDAIRVNSIAPTFVLTDLTESMLADTTFSEFVMNMIPMKKLASLDDVANASVFLLSNLSGSTTGACLKVDGGWTAQ
jgi:NAD(P)-dependent dehydrogenase (short-subunit alcohol dehydrogenase family)